MKLQFESNQQYQLDAIDAAVDIFAGQPEDSDGAARHMDQDGQLSLEATIARGNSLVLDTAQIAKNVRAVQQRNDILADEVLAGESGVAERFSHGMNFSIEMETGTGKTYVYLRTIHELHQHYGWKKFIIVVPSVAIREGVLKIWRSLGSTLLISTTSRRWITTSGTVRKPVRLVSLPRTIPCRSW